MVSSLSHVTARDLAHTECQCLSQTGNNHFSKSLNLVRGAHMYVVMGDKGGRSKLEKEVQRGIPE